MAKVINQTTINRSAGIAARENRELQRFAARLDSRYEKQPVVMSAVTAGRNQVQIGGNLYPAEGIEGQGGAVAVVNVGTAAVAKYAPANRRSVVGLAGSGHGGSGGPGGGGPVYLAGDAIDINGSNQISVKLDAAGAIILGGTGRLKNNVGDGIQILSNALTLNLATNPALEYVAESGTNKVRVKVGNGMGRDASGVFINLATNPGLEFGTAGDAGKLKVKPYHGLELTSNGAGVKLLSGMTAMAVDANGLAIADVIAGNGMTINSTTKVLAVGAGDGIDSNANDVAVDVTDIINTSFGIYEPTANDIGINVVGNTGLLFLGTGALALGSPSTLSVTSSNHVTSTTHGHAITTSSDVGTVPAQAILASTTGGALTLAQLTLRGNLIFAGGDRSITASNNLTIAPTTDLKLNPTGLIILGDTGEPSGQEMRTPVFNDFVAGISGLRHWDTGGNVRQLTIGKIKADELFVRVFTADEARVNRGEEFWTRSFGIVETAFTVPADEATVDVWFEEAPGLGSFKLFLPDNWILIRSIDWTTSLVVQAIWFQVVDADGAGTNDYVSRVSMVPGTDSRPSRQQWRLRRKSGGLTGTVIKAGNVAVDFGKPFSVTTPSPGQGVVHLSALAQDGGPFVQIQTFESVSSDVPQFKNRVRMGNLTGTVDYASDVFGFAAGDDLSKTPSTGFSGIAAEATNGLRLFNVNFALYDGSTLAFSIDKNVGIRLLQDGSEYGDGRRYIKWYDSISPLGNLTGELLSYTTGVSGVNRFMRLREIGPAGTNVDTWIAAQNPSGSAEIRAHVDLAGSSSVSITADQFTSNAALNVLRETTIVYDFNVLSQDFFGVGLLAPVSTAHFYEQTTNVGASAGVTIEQAGSGDAVVQFLLTGGQRWVAGIDNSDGDKYKIASSADLGTATRFTISGANVGIGGEATSPRSLLDVRGAGAIMHSAPSSSAAISFQHIVVTDTSFARMVVGHNALWNFSTNVWDVSAFGANDASAYLVENGGAMRWIIHPNTGNTARTFTHANFVAGTLMYLGTGGNWSVAGAGQVGGIDGSPDSRFVVHSNDTATGTTAGLTVRQSGTGDAVVQFLLTGGQRWVMGIDNSVSGDPFVISPSTDLANGIFALTPGGDMGLGVIAPGVDIIGTLDYNATPLFHIKGTSPAILIAGTNTASLDLIALNSAANQQWLRLYFGSTETAFFSALNDSGAATFNFLAMDSSTGYIGMNSSATPAAHLDLVANSANAIRSSVMSATAYYNFVGRRSNGSPTSPTAVLNGHIMFSIGASGYTSSGWSGITSGELSAVAAENFTSTAQGTKWRMWVTKIGTVTKSIAMDLGDDRQAFFPGVYAHTTADAANVHVHTDGWLRRSTSARRYKTDIRPLPLHSQLFDRLQPVLYKPANGVGGGARDYPGLIAEDVLEAGGRDFVTFNKQGQADYVMYDRLVVLTIGEVQALKREMQEAKQRIVELERMVKA